MPVTVPVVSGFFSLTSERQAHLVRWVLLLEWPGLILSVLADVDPCPFDANPCGRDPACHTHEGNQVFWGMVVSAAIFILVVFGHELWRRICPLAFVSQLFRALGRGLLKQMALRLETHAGSSRRELALSPSAGTPAAAAEAG